MTDLSEQTGPIGWMARNRVAANMLMAVLIIGGLVMTFRIKQEVFPEIDLDIVQIVVPYPGASPAEVEQGIVLAIEEQARGLEGVKRVRSRAFEGSGLVQVELLLGEDANKLQQDVKNAIDQITSFPEESERPIVSLLTNRREVISLVVYGRQDDRSLRRLAEQVRQELLADPKIVQVELKGVRPLEISVEVPQATLRAYDLTLDRIAGEVSRGAIELPGGGVKTPGGEVLVRTAERRDLGQEFAGIPVVSRADGTQVELGELATIIDGFADTDSSAMFDGQPAVKIVVYRVGDQTPLEIAAIVHDYAEKLHDRLPPGFRVHVWQDWSEIYRQRMDLLLRNAGLGLLLVLVLLGLFLEVRLAFWVTLGIPVSILGSLLLVPLFDVSINMISLFAFIITIGIVVDDAIIVGENVYEHRQRGMPFLKAAILGAERISMPVIFAVLTNMVTFMPMFFVPGIMGKFFRVIPAVVVAVFCISLVESLFVLPAHLGHQRKHRTEGMRGSFGRFQEGFARLLERGIRGIYGPVVRAAVRNRYLTAAVAIAILAATIGFAAGGHINFTFFPRIESDVVVASVRLPYGTAVEETRAVQGRLVAAAKQILSEHGGKKITRGIFSQIGSDKPAEAGGPGGPGAAAGGGHLAYVQVYMVPVDQRPIRARAFAEEWRRRTGDLVGLESLVFDYALIHAGGAPIDVELSHTDVPTLERAAGELAEKLKGFTGVIDIDDGVSLGKSQLDFKVRPEARSLGITAADLGRQVRSCFYGAEALRQQRGRDEVKVMVRLPEAERKSEYNVEELLVRTAGGGEIPLREAAEVIRGRAYTEIKRADGRRVINVTADIVPGVANAGKVLEVLAKGHLPKLLARYAGLAYSLEGEQREQRESLGSLKYGFLLALVVIFAMLAVPFRSYVQPVIVMTAIPFGIVGAVLGHILMGFDLSLMSVMGIVALAGVVVNDSLVLVHAANENSASGLTPFQAVTAAGQRRFRPIMLTSLTTFLGLAPMIFETSIQAQFLIPMAVSLGYGILFVTFVTLLLVPSLYVIIDDMKRAVAYVWPRPPAEESGDEQLV